MNGSYITKGGMLGMALLLAAGCASQQQAVKKDETAAAAPVAAKAKEQAPAKDAGVIKATALPIKEDTPQSGLAAKEAQQGDQALRSALDAIYFDFDATALTPAARETLGRTSENLKKHAAMRLRIEGNCDERGSDEYNLALGDKRALAAKQYLTTLGIPADRLSTISNGKEKPADQAHTEAAWAKNRRDDFIIVK